MAAKFFNMALLLLLATGATQAEAQNKWKSELDRKSVV